MGLVIYFWIVPCIGLLEASVCPPKEDVAPCECYPVYGDNLVSCTNILSPEELIPPMRSIAMYKTKVLALTIEKSSLLYLPDKLFKNAHIEMEIICESMLEDPAVDVMEGSVRGPCYFFEEIICESMLEDPAVDVMEGSVRGPCYFFEVHFDNTEIMSLSESDTAFTGLEDILTEIRAIDAKFVSHWNFDQLRNLKKLNLIDVHHMILSAVDHPFPHLPELTSLGIISAEISYSIDDAFSNLTKLRIFNVKDNEITEMKRNMLPNPANSLSYIDLRQNKLSSLPPDFFENMPSLTNVHLDKNKFVTLSENPFSKAISNLQQLWMTDNPFHCDCRMNWLVNKRFPQHFEGKCSAPEALSGRSITSLDFKSLWC